MSSVAETAPQTPPTPEEKFLPPEGNGYLLRQVINEFFKQRVSADNTTSLVFFLNVGSSKGQASMGAAINLGIQVGTEKVEQAIAFPGITPEGVLRIDICRKYQVLEDDKIGRLPEKAANQSIIEQEVKALKDRQVDYPQYYVLFSLQPASPEHSPFLTLVPDQRELPILNRGDFALFQGAAVLSTTANQREVALSYRADEVSKRLDKPQEGDEADMETIDFLRACLASAQLVNFTQEAEAQRKARIEWEAAELASREVERQARMATAKPVPEREITTRRSVKEVEEREKMIRYWQEEVTQLLAQPAVSGDKTRVAEVEEILKDGDTLSLVKIYEELEAIAAAHEAEQKLQEAAHKEELIALLLETNPVGFLKALARLLSLQTLEQITKSSGS